MATYTTAEINAACAPMGDANMYFLSPNVWTKAIIVDGRPATITRPHSIVRNGTALSVPATWRFDA